MQAFLKEVMFLYILARHENAASKDIGGKVDGFVRHVTAASRTAFIIITYVVFGRYSTWTPVVGTILSLAQSGVAAAAHLSLGSVGRTQHAPLRRLQGARPADLPRLLELGGDPGHHAQSRNIGETRQNLGHTLTVHLESLQRPVALWTQSSLLFIKSINQIIVS